MTDVTSGLAEVSESAAEGRTAEIYEALRAATGLPLVNLVWRHMAATDGLLDWAWSVMGPPLENGAIEAAASALVDELPDRSVARLQSNEVGSSEAREALRSVFATYNRANPINLLSLELITAALAGRDAPTDTASSMSARPSRRDAALPPFATDVDAGAAAAIRRMSILVTEDEAGPTPSVFRHLAHWPEAIAALEPRLQGVIDGGGLVRDAERVGRRAHETAATIGRGSAPPPDSESAARITQVINIFTPAISRMIVIGRALEPAFAEPEAA